MELVKLVAESAGILDCSGNNSEFVKDKIVKGSTASAYISFKVPLDSSNNNEATSSELVLTCIKDSRAMKESGVPPM